MIRWWPDPGVTIRWSESFWRSSANPSALCPDLRYEQIGAADNLRGRVVRAFFWLMRAWPAR